MIDLDDLLDQHLDHIGDSLYHSERTYPVRTQTALEESTDFPLCINQAECHDCISDQ